MPWRPHGHVRVNARSPEAAGICDRCGRPFNLRRLVWQWEWTGPQLLNLRILVCESCYDEPQQQLRARILSPDPVPVLNARPEPFAFTGINYEQTNFFLTDTEVILLTEDGLSTLVSEGNFTFPGYGIGAFEIGVSPIGGPSI